MTAYANAIKTLELSRGANYELKKGQKYGFYNQRLRLVAVARVLDGEAKSLVAKDIGCCRTSVSNWVLTMTNDVKKLSEH